jgi:hypothetical protein
MHTSFGDNLFLSILIGVYVVIQVVERGVFSIILAVEIVVREFLTLKTSRLFFNFPLQMLHILRILPFVVN